MKFLRNPIITGILAVVAVFVLAYQFSSGAMRRFHPARITKRLVTELVKVASHAPPPMPDPVPKNSVSDPDLTPDSEVDRNYLEGHFAKWVATPQRDPFLLFSTDKEKNKEEAEFASPLAKWKLQGIWDQTGGKLAVINKRVHRVGDEIEGYKILRIEADEVWFQGPKRKERLAMDRRGPAVMQNPIFLPPTSPLPSSAVPQ